MAEEGARMQGWHHLLRRSRLVVFDFDGTLVDSLPIKWRAFERCFERFPEHAQAIRAYCRGNNHTPRWEKFRHVYEKILRLPYTPKVERQLHRRFEQETTVPISQAPELPGASAFLTYVRKRHPTALLSSTPHEILLTILQRRRWGDCFDQVQGAPVNKAAWLKQRATQGLAPNQILFFGDTPEDADSAREAGCGFIDVQQLGDFRKLMEPGC